MVRMKINSLRHVRDQAVRLSDSDLSSLLDYIEQEVENREFEAGERQAEYDQTWPSPRDGFGQDPSDY